MDWWRYCINKTAAGTWQWIFIFKWFYKPVPTYKDDLKKNFFILKVVLSLLKKHQKKVNIKLSAMFSSLHHHHLSLNREGCWGATNDFETSFIHFSLFSTALWDLANSRPVHSLMLTFHLFLYLPCLPPPFTVPCKIVLARPDEQET